MPSGVAWTTDQEKSDAADRSRAVNREYMRRKREEDPAGTSARKRVARGLPLPTRHCPETCECCGCKPYGPTPAQCVLQLDHSHNTGLFRGWICYRCNLGLAMFDDLESKLTNAIDYLTRNEFTPDG